MNFPACRHALHVYRSTEHLARHVAAFAQAGLDRGEPVILVPSREHREPLLAELRRRGVDVDALIADGRLMMCDADFNAEKCLAASSVDELWDCFLEAMAGLRARGFHRITIWGETPDVLRLAGRRDLFLDLENKWVGATRGDDIDLLCSFRADLLDPRIYAQALPDACATHTHVVETEDAPRLETADEDLEKALGLRNYQMLASLAEQTPVSRAAMPRPLRRMLWVAQHLPSTARRALEAARARFPLP